ncbi:ATP-binding protein [Paenibacillus sp. CC-CFT747]|nr:ATP-binding protein [Paenibacillus sp. CC-CFT747]
MHYLKVAEDITKKKHTEGLLRKSEMLSVAGQLASGIAHEIRNPLTSVKGFLKLLNTKQGDQEKYMEILSAEVDSMELIINELLLLAKTQIFEFATKDLRVILQNVVMLLSSQAILKNIEFVVECELESVHMNCVENQIKQMFVNLLKNAIEATPYGGQIFIQIRNAVYGKVMIRLVDKGCGIPKEQLDRIGEPFYTTKQKGTGLGLMICHQIIENHQGQMRFQSEVNKGTTIDILLPLHIEGGHRSLAQPGSELFQSILK